MKQTMDTDWEQDAQLFAQAMNKDAELVNILTAYDHRAAQLKQLINQKQAVIMRWMPQGALLLSPGIFSAKVGQMSALKYKTQA